MAVGIASLDHEVTALNKADIGKSLPHTSQCLSIGTFRSDPEIANAYPLIRLGKRHAKRRDELASLHSITLSARASNIGGMVMPSALAVFRLMMRSNLVGCSTGISAGCAPRRILFTNSAARRDKSGKLAP